MTANDQHDVHPGCRICGTPLEFFDTGRVLDRYDVEYRRCPGCGLICLPEPWWLDEAYDSAIYCGDTGLLRRSRVLSRFTATLIRSEGIGGGRFLDWAGGFGTLARMMRDKGFDYYTADAYADNLLAPGFDGDVTDSYDLVTGFEVMEHLADPYAELADLARRNDRLFFTTQIQPPVPPHPDEWWYYAPESGQHITFHTVDSLRILAERLGHQLTSDGDWYHMFHRVPLRPSTKALLSPGLAKTKRAALRGARAGVGALRAARSAGR